MINLKLTELIDAIEFHSEMMQSFIYLKTGKICFVTEDAINIVEREQQDFPEWQNEDVKTAKLYLENPNDFLDLPTQQDADEYQMMEDFASNLEDDKAANQLLIALRGKGAFRRFKDNINLLELEKDWFKFRDKRYRQFAIEWCEENKFNFEDEVC